MLGAVSERREAAPTEAAVELRLRALLGDGEACDHREEAEGDSGEREHTAWTYEVTPGRWSMYVPRAA